LHVLFPMSPWLNGGLLSSAGPQTFNLANQHGACSSPKPAKTHPVLGNSRLTPQVEAVVGWLHAVGKLNDRHCCITLLMVNRQQSQKRRWHCCYCCC
jgi:hypothetical protein